MTAAPVPRRLAREVPALEQIAADEGATTVDRITAVRDMATVATPAAQSALLRHATDRDARVQQAALAALGTFADPSALEALVAIAAPTDPSTRRQLVLARALIAHRHGLAQGPFLPERPGVRRQPGDPSQMITLTLRTKSGEASTSDRRRLHGPTFGVELADQAFELKAGRAEWTVFVNRDLGPSVTVLARLFERPWVTALLGRWSPDRLRAIVQYVVLSRPVDDGVRLDVVRRDGEVMYTGSARRDGTAIAFAVADVDRRGTAPTNVSGSTGPDGLELDVTVPFRTRRGTRETSPATP
jgi:hypothetical protein